MLCFKLTKDFAKKLHVKLSDSPPADCMSSSIWLANEFIWRRIRYVIVMHETSLFTVVFYGKGVNNDNAFLQEAFSSIGECMKRCGLEDCFSRFVSKEALEVSFARTDSRSVIGSMNEMTKAAKVLFDVCEISPAEASERLNETPMSLLRMDSPKDTFKRMASFNLVGKGS
jgi:hypothetical protein